MTKYREQMEKIIKLEKQEAFAEKLFNKNLLTVSLLLFIKECCD